MQVECQFCNKIFKKFYCSIKRTKNNYCSMNCYNKFRSKNKSINNNKKILFNERSNLKGKKGSGYITKYGYKQISVPWHPNTRMCGQIFEHVFVMSQYLGRPLNKGETVHHKNGDKLDNRIENLELWHKGQPPGQRVEDKIKFYKEFLEQYGYKVELQTIPHIFNKNQTNI